VKESIFNILGGDLEGKLVLDLFAGTGNLGIEALSRGARKVFFVERGRQALGLIKKNLSQCRMENRSEVLPKDSMRAVGILNQKGEVFDLIFMDPPYEKGWVKRMLAKLQERRIYHEGSLLVVEHDRREPLPKRTEGWNLIRQRQIGDTLISFLKATNGMTESV
jgi:16S rRNA (guanine(966)-N(2))-methyltransferase RsmD